MPKFILNISINSIYRYLTSVPVLFLCRYLSRGSNPYPGLVTRFPHSYSAGIPYPSCSRVLKWKHQFVSADYENHVQKTLNSDLNNKTIRKLTKYIIIIFRSSFFNVLLSISFLNYKILICFSLWFWLSECKKKNFLFSLQLR